MSKRGRPVNDQYHQLPLPPELTKYWVAKTPKRKPSRNGKTYEHLYTQLIPAPPPEENVQLSTLSTPPTSAIAQPQEG